MAEEKKTRGKKKAARDDEYDFYDYDEYDTKKTSSRKKKGTDDEDAKPLKDSKKKKEKKAGDPRSVGNQLAIVLLAVLAVFLGICFAFRNDVGILGLWLSYGFFGIFGIGAWLVPFLLLQLALFWKRDVASGAVKYKYLVSIFFLLFTSALIHAFYSLAEGAPDITFETAFTLDALKTLFVNGMNYQGGGFLGGLLASAFICAVGYPGMMIFGFLFFFAFGLSLFGLTPSECMQRILFYRQRNRNIKKLQKEKEEKKRAEDEEKGSAEPREQTKTKRTAKNEEEPSAPKKKKRGASIDRDIFEDDMHAEKPKDEIDREPARETKKNELREIFVNESAVPAKYSESEEASLENDIKIAETDIVMSGANARGKIKTTGKKAEPQNDEISILPPEPMVEAPAVEDDEAVEVIPERPVYEFPPIDFLQEPPTRKDENVSAELRENADRIIQTLESFHVRVTISNVSRGPTITRYELEPSAGTRVRSILNLLDDIALSLATSGVRSDGIIPGKNAIGIEVPNKITNTVYVRELIEDSRFEAAKSKLTASLGMDVSGAPVYFDIAKMPHLLIAGATGQGKSVCINSILISLLYKASPDDLKLILIDPKKVELNVYNGIPHLLVPVVFDPKKAAGSLHWAVTEMERRFELIEAQNVRNLAQYNAAIADDPTKEKLPQVVIIIDELADLMMSAPDDVETSICRLAQKARAAGMHLIIGTQRPSVDVITGLIKANIPSRIAFTVRSQIDSRTILDAQGAEKLIGKGDMLFAPVGCSKPVRVQGAFVSEKEIEDVIDFIRAQSNGSAYSDDVMEQINKAADLCGQKKGKTPGAAADADDMEDDDPMLGSAIELAVESGKISTSLIQRRLSLGYGRAAKLIDVMERRGIVSPPEGQKPRTVLITREQYLEMQMNGTMETSASSEDEPPFDL